MFYFVLNQMLYQNLSNTNLFNHKHTLTLLLLTRLIPTKWNVAEKLK